MKRLTGFLSLSIILCSMAFTASSHPPTEKLTHKTTITSNDNIVLHANEMSFDANVYAYALEQAYGFDLTPVSDATNAVKIEFYKANDFLAFKGPGKLNNKFFRPWLTEPVKLC